MVYGSNSIHMDINDKNADLASVYVNTNTVISLTEEMLTEWDMLTDEQRENLKDIAGQITAMAVE
jgi:hypothetical protein